MRDISRGQVQRLARDFLGERAELELETLAFQGPNNSKADGARNRATELDENKKAGGGGALYFEKARDVAKRGRKVTARNLNGKRLAGGNRKRFSHRFAGAVGDVIAEEHIAKFIHFGESLRSAVDIKDERERRLRELLQRGGAIGLKRSNLPQLPGSLQTA